MSLMAAQDEIRALVAKEVQAVELRIARKKRAAKVALETVNDGEQPRTLLAVLERLWRKGKTQGKGDPTQVILLPNGRKLAGSFHGTWEELDQDLSELAKRLARMLAPPTRSMSHRWELVLPTLDIDRVIEKAGFGPAHAVDLCKPMKRPRKQLKWVAALQASIQTRLEALVLFDPRSDAVLHKKALDRAKAMFALMDHTARIQALDLSHSSLPHPRDASASMSECLAPRKTTSKLCDSLILDGEELDSIRERWTRMTRANLEIRAFQQIGYIPGLERVHLPFETGQVVLHQGQHFAHISFTQDLGDTPWLDFVMAENVSVSVEECVADGFVLRVRQELDEPVKVLWRALHTAWRRGKLGAGPSAATLVHAGIFVDYPMRPVHLLQENVDAVADQGTLDSLLASVGLEEMLPFESPPFPAWQLHHEFHDYVACLVLDPGATMLRDDCWPRAKFLVREFLGNHGARVFGHGGRLVLISGEASFEISDFSEVDRLVEAQRWVASLCSLAASDSLEKSLAQIACNGRVDFQAVHVLTNDPSFDAEILAGTIEVPVHHVRVDTSQMDAFLVESKQAFLDLSDANKVAANLEEVERGWKAEVARQEAAYRAKEEEVRQRNRARLAAAKSELAVRRRARATLDATRSSLYDTELARRARWRWINLARLYEKQRALVALNEFLAAASVKVILREREAREAATDVLVRVLEGTMVAITKTSWSAVSASVQDEKSSDAAAQCSGMHRVLRLKDAALRELMTTHFRRDVKRSNLRLPGSNEDLTTAFLPLRSAAARAERWKEDVVAIGRAKEKSLLLMEANRQFMLEQAQQRLERHLSDRRKRFEADLQDFLHGVLVHDVERAARENGVSSMQIRGWNLQLQKWKLGLADFGVRKGRLEAQVTLLAMLDRIQGELMGEEQKTCLLQNHVEEDLHALVARDDKILGAVPDDEVNRELLRTFRARAGFGACSQLRREFGCFSRPACEYARDARCIAEARARGELATLAFEAENAARKRMREALRQQGMAHSKAAYRSWRQKVTAEMREEFELKAVAPTKTVNTTLEPLDRLAQAALRELKLVEAFSKELTRARRRVQRTSEASGPTLTLLRRAIEGAFQCIPGA